MISTIDVASGVRSLLQERLLDAGYRVERCDVIFIPHDDDMEDTFMFSVMTEGARRPYSKKWDIWRSDDAEYPSIVKLADMATSSAMELLQEAN